MIIIMEIGSVAILAHPPTADPADLISIMPIKQKLLRPGARLPMVSPAEALFPPLGTRLVEVLVEYALL